MEMLAHTNFQIKDSDIDAVILNCGETGSGKSTYDLVMGIYYEEQLNHRPFTLVNTVFAPKQFQTRLSQSEQYSFITGDEGIELGEGKLVALGLGVSVATGVGDGETETCAVS